MGCNNARVYYLNKRTGETVPDPNERDRWNMVEPLLPNDNAAPERCCHFKHFNKICSNFFWVILRRWSLGMKSSKTAASALGYQKLQMDGCWKSPSVTTNIQEFHQSNQAKSGETHTGRSQLVVLFEWEITRQKVLDTNFHGFETNMWFSSNKCE